MRPVKNFLVDSEAADVQAWVKIVEENFEMLGSLRRAISMLNAFGKADEPSNEVENESEITGFSHNVKDESHRPDQISEGNISLRDMKVTIDSHPEGSGGDVRVMTYEGRQIDVNLDGPLAAADDPVDDGLRHGHGLSKRKNGVNDISNYRTLGRVTGPAVSSPMGPAEIDCYSFQVGYQGAQRNNDGPYAPITTMVEATQETGWQMPPQNRPVVQIQPRCLRLGLCNNAFSLQNTHELLGCTETSRSMGGIVRGLQTPPQMTCRDAAASVTQGKVIQGNVPEASLLSCDKVTVPMIALERQEIMPSGKTCQSLYTGPQMVLANAAQEVSAGTGTPGVKSSVDQVLSVVCTRTKTGLATGAVAPMDLSSQRVVIPDGTSASTTLREFLPKAALGAEALLPKAETPQQSMRGVGFALMGDRAADTGYNDTELSPHEANPSYDKHLFFQGLNEILSKWSVERKTRKKRVNMKVEICYGCQQVGHFAR